MGHERRVFIEFPAGTTDLPFEMPLTNEQKHHLVKVLRLEEGSAVIAVAEGTEYEAIITGPRTDPFIKILSRRNTERATARSGAMVFALSKGDKNDFVCEKACELGADRIIFWQSARSVVKLAGQKEIEKKLSRWKTIATGAAEQCCRVSIPEVVFAQNLNQMIEAVKTGAKEADLLLCCSLSKTAREMRLVPAPKGRVHILVGPEGDFTPAEEDEIVRHGFTLASLGRLVLRSETAAVCALSMANGIWGDLE